jgi:hypothetical protein
VHNGQGGQSLFLPAEQQVWIDAELLDADGSHNSLAPPATASSTLCQCPWRSCRDKRDRAAPAFVPVHVLPAATALEVVLGSGRVVRVPAGFDAATLRLLRSGD